MRLSLCVSVFLVWAAGDHNRRCVSKEIDAYCSSVAGLPLDLYSDHTPAPMSYIIEYGPAGLYIRKVLIARNQSILRIISYEKWTILLPYMCCRMLIMNCCLKNVEGFKMGFVTHHTALVRVLY